MSGYSVLVAASSPPPVAGQSVATMMLRRALERERVEHRHINLARGFHTKRRLWSFARRAGQVSLLPVWWVVEASQLTTTPRLFYLQLGQSTEAMMRDLPLLGLAAALGWSSVLHIHGGGFRAAFDHAPRLVRLSMRAALRRADRVVVLSNRLRAMLDGLVQPDRVAVVANGVEQEVVDYALGRTHPSIAGDPLVVLYLSNLIDSKGYRDVLEAARLSAAARLPHRFVLAGAETETTTVSPRAFIERHGLHNTRFVGPVTGARKLDLLAAADIFTLPTTYPVEGQPIAILEAMHFGMPILTTATGGIPDIVGHGENGFLLPPHDPHAILEAVERLAADGELLQRMREANVHQARQRFTETAHAQAMLSLFTEVARRHSAD